MTKPLFSVLGAALVTSSYGCHPPAPPPTTPIALNEPPPKKAEPSSCIDGVELVLRAPSHAGFAPGSYEIGLDFEGQERSATCEIRAKDEDSSCAPMGHSTSAFQASLGRRSETITVVMKAHPHDIDLDVKRDAIPIARTTISPRYETVQSSDGATCSAAFVALGLR